MAKPRSTNTPAPVTVPSELRWAEALHRRSMEIAESILASESMMAQIRESIAEAERGEPGVPWRELRGRAGSAPATADV